MPTTTSGLGDILDVAIVGAGRLDQLMQTFVLYSVTNSLLLGLYGLKAAQTYLQLKPDISLVIFEKDRFVGGTWSRDRIYSDLVAQAEYGYFVSEMG